MANDGAQTEGPRVPIATAVMTKSARGAGRWTFGVVGIVTLALKLYEFGAITNWALFGDVARLMSGAIPQHGPQWARLVLILLESLATAAVVSVAITYVVVNQSINNTTNNTSTDNSSTTTTNVTHVGGPDSAAIVASIGAQLAEIRDRVAGFEAHLVRTQESERARMVEFLSLAESDRNKRQADQLKADKELFADIGETLRKIVAVIGKDP